MATLDEILVGSIGDANIGAAAAVGFLNPMSAQLDALIAFSLGPLQADVSAQLDAAIALQANLALQIAGPSINLTAALEAIAQLQAALSAGIELPSVSLSAELGAAAALSAALTAKLGGLNLLIQAAIDLKIPAVRAAAELAAALSGPGVVLLSVDGIADGTTLADIGGLVDTAFNAGIGGGTIDSTDPASGVILMVKDASVFTQLGVIIKTVP